MQGGNPDEESHPASVTGSISRVLATEVPPAV